MKQINISCIYCLYHLTLQSSILMTLNYLPCHLLFARCVRWGRVMQVIAAELCKPFCPLWPAAHHRTLYLVVSVSTSELVYCVSST